MMNLLDLQDIQSEARPFARRPVVYFLFLRGELRYIGQSKNFHFRIGTHATGLARKEFDAYSFVEVPDGVDPEDMELSYILKFTPPENRAGFHPSTWVDKKPLAMLDRIFKAVDSGVSIRDVANQEGISAKTIEYRLHQREKRQYEENELLLSSGDAGQAEASIRPNGDAGIGVHPKGGRSCAEENRTVEKIPQGCLFD